MINFKCVVLILFCSSVVFCEKCITYNFEENFDNLFTNEKGVCINMMVWDIKNYQSISVPSPHPSSTMFITPKEALSCVSSFTFSATSGGAVEAHIYMESESPMDQISFVVNEIIPGGNDGAVGTTLLSSMNPNFSNGWHILRVTLTGRGTFNAYVSTCEVYELNFIYVDNITKFKSI